MVLDFISHKYLSRVDNVKRFGLERVIKEETIAQHNFWVSTFASLIVEEIPITKKTVKEEIELRVFRKCRTHDIDEIFSGDIDHNAKYNSFNGFQIKKNINEYCLHRMTEEFKGTLLHEYTNKDYFCDFIIKIADWYACIKQVVVEISLGNVNMKNVLEICCQKLIIHIDNFIGEIHAQQSSPNPDYLWMCLNKETILYLKTQIETIEIKRESFWVKGLYN